MTGLDYASPVTDKTTLSRFKDNGVQFVCRYISTPGNPKNITAQEVTALSQNGLKLVVVFETTANRALGGFAAGQHDAKSAQLQLHNLWLNDAVVYFAVDFDVPVGNLDTVTQYFAGVTSVLGKDRVGVYGGLRIVKHLLDNGLCKYAWQTYAWSGGKWDPRAHIQQYLNGQRVAGVSCDYDRAMATNYGQWPLYVAPPKPADVPVHYAPPWPVFVGDKQIANGRLINPVVVFRIARALKAVGKFPPYYVDFPLMPGRFWPPGPFTKSIAARLRAGHDVIVSGLVTIKTRKV